MDRLQRLRYITERYEQLQGLRLIPLGIPFLLSAAWRDGHLSWMPWTEGKGARVWFVLLMALAFTVSRAVRIYYRHHFGDVQPAATVKAPLAAFVFVALFILAISIPGGPQPVSIPALVIAVGLAWVGVVGGQIRPHYLAIAAFVAVFAVLGLLDVPVHTRDVIFDQIVGVGLIVVGIGDHLILRRSLVPVSHANAF